MSDKYSLTESLKKVEYTVRWIGIPLEKKEGKIYKYHLIYIFNFIWLNTDVAGAIFWFIEGAKRGESLTSLTYVAPCITLSFLAAIKSMCFIIYSEQVHTLITTLKALEIKEKSRPQTEEKNEIIKKETDFLHLVLKVLNFFNWTLIIAFPLMPLSLTFLNYIQTQELNPLLPFLIVYPFNAYDVRVWPFVFVRQIWSEIIVVLEVCGADFIFFISSTYIRIQFHLLAYEVDRLIADSNSSRQQRQSEDARFKRHFQDIVQWHQQLIDCVGVLEVIYCKSTLFNFVSSSALICLTGFNVTTIDDVAFVVSFLSFLFMSLLQIYFLCFFGDMLMRASEGVSLAAYNCKWYLADQKTAKMLFIVQTRAQKACKLTAYGFADVNLMAFTKILSTAWSYFALLKTVYSSPRG